MTWEELCKKAKEMAQYYCFFNEYYIEFERIFLFFEDGTIQVCIDACDDECVVARFRTYEQMYQIMDALR